VQKVTLKSNYEPEKEKNQGKYTVNNGDYVNNDGKLIMRTNDGLYNHTLDNRKNISKYV
jgi:hypothetical protein